MGEHLQATSKEMQEINFPNPRMFAMSFANLIIDWTLTYV